MKIKKLGHSCLVIEENGKRIMTDPGSFTAGKHIKEKNIDLILITHEHGDHLDIPSLKKVIENNPNVTVVTNSGVGKLLTEAGIKYEILEKGTKEFSDIVIEVFECKHEEIFEDYGLVKNSGYFIGKRLFCPGDSYCNPGKPVEILALPVAGPWANTKKSTEYAMEINPKYCFPVHDGMLNTFGSSHKVPEIFLTQAGTIFKNFEENKEEEF